MKIAVIGGGSTYSPELIHGLAEAALGLGLLEVALHDLDPARLEIVGDFLERMVAAQGKKLSITRHLERKTAIGGAHFVLVQIRVGGQLARLEDERLGRTHGVIGQETTGIGGLAKALRTIPVLLQIAADIERYAPGATLVDFTNPVSIVTEALLRHGRVPTIGLCNIPISQREELAAHLGVASEEVELDSVGLNHLSFIRGVKVRGQEQLPRLLEELAGALASGKRPANLPDLDFPPELLTELGMIPSDYLRYFYLAPDTIAEQQQKPKLRAEEVMAVEAELLAYYGDLRRSERPEALKKRGGAFYSRAAVELITGIHHNTGEKQVVNVANRGIVPELPEGCSIEVPCRIDAQGATPLPQRPLEPVIRGLIQHVKAYEELAVQAALSHRRRDLYQAVLAHPLTPSAKVAARLTDALVVRLTPEW
ncbi:MAG: 6-phospho-beta-glucosidase [Deltaproteobacteria bacterium]|nr:6-phospho-beta-glucosidase [Deltaproteobacteria bacterium]